MEQSRSTRSLRGPDLTVEMWRLGRTLHRGCAPGCRLTSGRWPRHRRSRLQRDHCLLYELRELPKLVGSLCLEGCQFDLDSLELDNSGLRRCTFRDKWGIDVSEVHLEELQLLRPYLQPPRTRPRTLRRNRDAWEMQELLIQQFNSELSGRSAIGSVMTSPCSMPNDKAHRREEDGLVRSKVPLAFVSDAAACWAARLIRARPRA
jgi:hypothetical protein